MTEKITFEDGSYVEGDRVRLGKNFRVGKNTIVRGREVLIEDNVSIGNATTISADYVHVGFGSKIEDNCRILMSGQKSKFSIGDNCLIGHDSKILIPSFEAGDYVALHNHLLVNGYKPCSLGHNVWVGQNCVLNSTDELRIGNGVGIGTYSCVWTHGFYGELIEGCAIYKVAPVNIEDDVWLVGSFNVVSPGVTIGRRAVVLTGSVIAKNVAPYACVAGNPAKDITDKLTPYRQVTVDEKYELMKTYMKEFVGTLGERSVVNLGNGWHVQDDSATYDILFVDVADDGTIEDDFRKVVFTKENATTRKLENVTIFDLSTKKYTKKRSDIEIKVIRFLLATKARFVPL